MTIKSQRRSMRNEKYEGLMEELDKRWEVKTTVVQVVIRALWVVTPKLGELLKQIPGTASTFCSDTTIVGTAKNLQAPSTRA